MEKPIVLLVLGSVLFASVPVFARDRDEEAPITDVTVFRDRASVKRKLRKSLSKGATTLIFRNVTPLADLDSLKASLSEKKQVTLMGIRTMPEYTLKSANSELERWTETRKRNEKKRTELVSQVNLLIQSNQNLDLLAQHYRDSFSLNLHQNTWSKGGFESFVKFLSTQADDLNGRWAKLYGEYRKVTADSEFAEAKIRALSSVSDRHTFTVSVDVLADTAVSTDVELQYLVTQSGWSSVYDLRIDPKAGKAAVEQHAFVWQKSGEDWRDVALTLSNVRSELRPVAPSISPYTLSYQEVKKVDTSVSGKTDSATALQVGAGGESSDADDHSISRNFKVPGAQTVRDGMARTRLFLARQESAYSERLELVAADYDRVFRKGELSNPFEWDLEAGPASVYYDGDFLQQIQLDTIARGNKFGVNAGVDHDFQITRWTNDKVEGSGLIDTKKHFVREVSVTLQNFGARKKNIRVYEQVPVSEIKEVAVQAKEKDKSPVLKDDDSHPGWHYWDLPVESRKSQTVSMSVDVAVPSSFNFSW